jgi:hypothetical protein
LSGPSRDVVQRGRFRCAGELSKGARAIAAI